MTSKKTAIKTYTVAAIEDALDRLTGDTQYIELQRQIAAQMTDIKLDALYNQRQCKELDVVYEAGFRDSLKMLLRLLTT